MMHPPLIIIPIVEQLKEQHGLYIDNIVSEAIQRAHSEDDRDEGGFYIKRYITGNYMKDELRREEHFKKCEACQQSIAQIEEDN